MDRGNGPKAAAASRAGATPAPPMSRAGKASCWQRHTRPTQPADDSAAGGAGAPSMILMRCRTGMRASSSNKAAKTTTSKHNGDRHCSQRSRGTKHAPHAMPHRRCACKQHLAENKASQTQYKSRRWAGAATSEQADHRASKGQSPGKVRRFPAQRHASVQHKNNAPSRG